MHPLTALLVSSLLVASAARAGEPDGWTFKAGEKGKPAVLLIHGLAASRVNWLSPADSWNIRSAHFKHWKAPKKQSGTSKLPKVKGDVRSVVLSPVDKHADEDGSFFRFLASQGFTVATWNQAPCVDRQKNPSNTCLDSDVFDAAYPSAREALAHLASLTTEDLALVAHSRGGLVARKLLKEPDAAVPALARVKWLVTLHSPHKGSSLATRGRALQKALKAPLSAVDLDFVPALLRQPVKRLLPSAGAKVADSLDELVTLAGLKGAQELDGNSSLVKGLAKGEVKRPGMKVYTFGGTSPRVVKVWARVYSDAGFDWKTSPRQLLDVPLDLELPFPALKKGGDLLVTDASSRLPWEDQHFSNKLNHAEVLWNPGVQKQVAALLTAAPTAGGGAVEVEAGEGDTEDEPDDDDGSDAAAPAAP